MCVDDARSSWKKASQDNRKLFIHDDQDRADATILSLQKLEDEARPLESKPLELTTSNVVTPVGTFS